jgi:hypothetical protein
MKFLAIGKSMANCFGISIVEERGLKLLNDIVPVKIGDVITIKGHDGRHYCHRIIKLENNLVTTKGDNFTESKPYEIDVPVKNIRGKVVWSWPRDVSQTQSQGSKEE